MTQTALKTFRKALKDKRAEIGLTNREEMVIQNSPDLLDQIQQAGERDYAIGHLERVSSRLQEVDTALRRMDAGEYGVCIHCGDDINLKRLAAVPWTSFCIGCQEVADRRNKSANGSLDPSFAWAF